MKRETLYFDTSVLSAYYDERAKERQDVTIKFWKDVLPNYKVFISEVTVKELGDTKDEKLRRKFRRLIKTFKVLNLRVPTIRRHFVKLLRKYQGLGFIC